MRQSKEMDDLLESMPRRTGRTKPNYGVGINDSTFCVSAKIEGACVNHRAYAAWTGMLKRCYYETYKKEMKTYEGCSVDQRWHKFSNFFRWWKNNYVEGWHIDKDIISPGNKVYSPDFCAYIPPSLNSFISLAINRDDDWPVGAYRCSSGGKYFTNIRGGNGKKHHLGTFETPMEAHYAWKAAKLDKAKEFQKICDEIHHGLYSGLLEKINSMR
ncbi:hypothetical protein [Citrobacter meridianamericanus]|uniref:AP2 domain-containing protein n=1 Tax=Citrobacter meridianamericanus TaxID=2894201 RepID=A0ABT1B8Q3_9ENTR|nr:hypothetical protein [Citrobacter meridianamericanus]MCO5781791.1 hypothetical protein [Citrobacter meridianamericanus]